MQVFITRPMPESGITILQRALGVENVRVRNEDSAIPRQELLDNASGLSGLLCFLSDKIDAALMDAAGPSLKVVANFAVGYDNIDLGAAAARNIHVTNTPDVLTDATADLAWTLILGAARRVGEAERYLRAGKWHGWGPRQFLGMSVYGATLGIYGMGRIGRAVATRARGFNMRVIYHDMQPLDAETEQVLDAYFVDKQTLVEEADIVTIHCPLTPKTHHAFTMAEFRRMKHGAVVVNTARGPVLDERDLCQALDEGHIFAAGLDVYEFEPHIQEALMRQERALLLPHLGSATVAARDAMACMAAENIVAALEGRRPPNTVTLPL